MYNYKQLKKIMKKHKKIFITGHSGLDLDAIGASVGIYKIALKYKLDPFIIINDSFFESGVSKVIKEIENYNIIKSEDLYKYNKEDGLLIIVDTNKEFLLQDPKLTIYFKTIYIIDHHEETLESIKTNNKIIDIKSSSACEIVTDIIRYLNVKLDKLSSTILLSGIVLDTNNFTIKTTKKTYYDAYYLTEKGADPKNVQLYLKEDLKDYIIRHKAVIDANIIDDKFIIVKVKEQLKKEDLAKIADILLNLNNVKASFVIGNRIDKKIGISARSNKEIDVGKLLNNLNGGGDEYSAAAVLEKSNLDEVYNKLVELLKEI